MITNRALISIIFATILSAAAPAPIVFAQTGGGDSSATRILEEVIVTAQKREENLQDVPISVATITSASMEDFVVTTWDDINIPGVTISQGPNSDFLIIRGVGSALNPGFDQSAPIYIDGTYFGRARAQRLGFMDIERVEVLKGPQPTYFGKNAIAGAFSITTKRPTDQFEAILDTSYEFEADELAIFAAASGPVSDTFKVRGAVKYRDLEGYLTNVAQSRDEPGREDLVGRLSAVWEPSDTVSIFAKLEYAQDDLNGGDTQLLFCAPGGAFDPTVEDCLFNETRASTFDNSDFVTGADSDFILGGFNVGDKTRVIEFEHQGAQVAITWDIGDYILDSNTSYYEFTTRFFAKADHSTLPLLAAGPSSAGNTEDFSQLSQEVRLLSPRDQNVRWMTGVYFDTNDYDTGFGVVVLPGILGVALGGGVAEEDESWGAFGELDIDIGEQATVKFGARYSEVEKRADLTSNLMLGAPGPLFPIPPASFALSGSRTDTDFQPSVTLEWRPNDTALLYASWKEGFKAGGFDHNLGVGDIDGLQFEPENATAYEFGTKFRLLDGAATLNLAAFRMEYENLQVVSFDSTTSLFLTSNAAESLSQGLEVEGRLAATDHITLSASLSFLDSEFESFPSAQCYLNPPQTVAEGCVGGVQDLSGAPLPFAPELSGNFSIEYNVPLNGQFFGTPIEFVSRLDWFYTDEYQTNTTGDPDTWQDSYSKIDLRLGIGAQNGKWDLAFVGRNLNDELTALFIGDQPGGGPNSAHFAVTGRPRQLAIQARVRFGEM